ncbi:MAG: hypothetical protein A4E28_02270 [Methanocella sp. PtaU1.Bin125]|nr:MAG: hypothetical protein A4E28_02270 [Methanocella sp. PtaU1.Bin125]
MPSFYQQNNTIFTAATKTPANYLSTLDTTEFYGEWVYYKRRDPFMHPTLLTGTIFADPGSVIDGVTSFHECEIRLDDSDCIEFISEHNGDSRIVWIMVYDNGPFENSRIICPYIENVNSPIMFFFSITPNGYYLGLNDGTGWIPYLYNNSGDYGQYIDEIASSTEMYCPSSLECEFQAHTTIKWEETENDLEITEPNNIFCYDHFGTWYDYNAPFLNISTWNDGMNIYTNHLSESYSYTLNLYPGWSLISVPIDLHDDNIEHFFPENVNNYVESVWAWDDSCQDWMYYSHDQNDYFYQYYPHLTNIQPIRGFWVLYTGTSAVSFPVYGIRPSQDTVSYDCLNSGWTIVGYPSTVLRSPGSLYSAAEVVWGWDASVQNWMYYGQDPYFYQYYPAINNLEPGHGYWVYKPAGGLRALDGDSDTAPLIPYLNASIVSSVIPDTMIAGHNYSVQITVKNTGSIEWNSSYGLMLGSVGDDLGEAACFGPMRVAFPAGTVVEPEGTYTWNFVMTAPNQSGTYHPEYQMVCSDSWIGENLSKTIVVYAPVTSYAYYKTHTIAGSSDGNLNNYQMRFLVHSGSGEDNGQNVYLNGHSLNELNDIRFTDSSDNLLSYWVESSNASMSIVWVKVPVVPTAGTIIKLYYGKMGEASASNGTATWEFFDDFNTFDMSKWAVTAGSPGINNGVMICNNSGIISNNFISASGKRIVSRVKTSHWSSTGYYESFAAASVSSKVLEADFSWYGQSAKSHTYVNWIDGQALGYYNIQGWSAGTWHTLIAKRLSNKIQWSVDMANTVDCMQTYWSDNAKVKIWSSNTGAEIDVDWVGIGPAVNNEPQHSTWGGETPVGTTTPVPVPGYSFVKYHTISGSSDGTLSNYQMRFVVHSGSGMDGGENVYLNGYSQSWPNDIRFTDCSDNLINYWIESSNASITIVWVKIPSIPTSGTVVKICYGKANEASASNGAATWEFFDNFSMLDTAKWTVSGGSPYVSNGILICANSGVVSNSYISTNGKRIVSRVKSAHWSSTGYSESFVAASGNSRSLEAEFSWSGESAKSHTYVNWIDGQALGYYNIQGWSAGTWHTLIAKRLSNKIRWSVDFVNAVDCTQTYWTDNAKVKVWSSNTGAEIDIDWIGIGPAVNNEPLHGTWEL